MLSRATADKATMTGYVPGGTAERDVEPGRRGEPVLDDEAALELTRLGAVVRRTSARRRTSSGRAGTGRSSCSQARPVTALPPPEADPPTDWSVPDPSALYVRASIVEQLPDPLSPLFADLVGPSVARSLQALVRELVGSDVVRDGDVDLPTVNGYAYYRYGLAGMARLLLHSGGAFRRLLSPEHGAEARWRTYAHPRYVEVVRAATASRRPTP